MTVIRRVIGDFALHANFLLGHARPAGAPSVTSRYDRADRVPEVREALQDWANRIDALLAKSKETEGGYERKAARED